jgi:hypothetical protein
MRITQSSKLSPVSAVERREQRGGCTRAARDLIPREDAPECVRRSIIERKALWKLAGDVTTRLFRPDAATGSVSDHRGLHHLMDTVEDDGDVQRAPGGRTRDEGTGRRRPSRHGSSTCPG